MGTSLTTKIGSKMTKPDNKDMITKANRISTGILLTSLIFITCPSIAINIFAFCGESKFEMVGPFYFIGLLCTEVFDNFAH
ncbi:hypothetical protein TELCIR_08727 [Teladorsagia circumcincta]|uniref:Uncharacterized protein n=1 Tax=Teladorsagia circumcincta TaxID=45464 RepID=A0A2G9UH27_TELCI|nr:hypothetical protein TELCIR_08727 [Teladorsagia circumcincta]